MAKINSIDNKASELTIDPGASGDSYTQYNINSVAKFRVGVDDDDSDKFKIASGNALGSSDTLVVTSVGEITKPLQPAFLAVLNSTISDVTGDSTAYSIVWDTEVFDQNSDFNGTTTFTAPLTARYEFNIGITLGDLTSSHTDGRFRLVTSNRTYSPVRIDVGAAKDANDNYGAVITVLADMDASDTATVSVLVANGTKVVDIVSNGSTDPYNWFSGSLQC